MWAGRLRVSRCLVIVRSSTRHPRSSHATALTGRGALPIRRRLEIGTFVGLPARPIYMTPVPTESLFIPTYGITQRALAANRYHGSRLQHVTDMDNSMGRPWPGRPVLARCVGVIWASHLAVRPSPTPADQLHGPCRDRQAPLPKPDAWASRFFVVTAAFSARGCGGAVADRG